MGRRVLKTGSDTGGIASLVRIISEYGRALEYDLMTRTGRTLDEYMDMGAAGIAALVSFTENLPIDSALYKAMNPKDEFAEWTETFKTNAILADIFDAYVKAHTKKGRKPTLYPRPKSNRAIGKGAIPISEFWDWWNEGV